jgi:Mg2+ and Co2+ transporter CorA
MDVLDDGAPPAGWGSLRGPVCVILRPVSVGRVAETARWLGADESLAERLMRSPHRRPAAYVEGEWISMVTFAMNELGEPAEVHVHVGERGLLVLCPEAVTRTVRQAVAPVGTPADASIAVLAAFAELSEEVVHRLAEMATAMDAGTTGLTSGTARRDISRMRTRLFGMQQLWLAHHRLFDDDVLTEALSAAGQRQLRRARLIFESSGTAAAQLYALLGDTLSRQATVVGERLTLVAIIFLPLTVSTGFFGMNFGWLTSAIGSVAAFVVLGVVLPVALVTVTLLGARWLTRD